MSTFGINESFGVPGKKFSINFSEANTKFCLGWFIMAIIVIYWITIYWISIDKSDILK